jgi:hypothetical protein
MCIYKVCLKSNAVMYGAGRRGKDEGGHWLLTALSAPSQITKQITVTN